MSESSLDSVGNGESLQRSEQKVDTIRDTLKMGLRVGKGCNQKTQINHM